MSGNNNKPTNGTLMNAKTKAETATSVNNSRPTISASRFPSSSNLAGFTFNPHFNRPSQKRVEGKIQAGVLQIPKSENNVKIVKDVTNARIKNITARLQKKEPITPIEQRFLANYYGNRNNNNNGDVVELHPQGGGRRKTRRSKKRSKKTRRRH